MPRGDTERHRIAARQILCDLVNQFHGYCTRESVVAKLHLEARARTCKCTSLDQRVMRVIEDADHLISPGLDSMCTNTAIPLVLIVHLESTDRQTLLRRPSIAKHTTHLYPLVPRHVSKTHGGATKLPSEQALRIRSFPLTGMAQLSSADSPTVSFPPETA